MNKMQVLNCAELIISQAEEQCRAKNLGGGGHNIAALQSLHFDTYHRLVSLIDDYIKERTESD